jgi:hypothetical protein
MNEVVIDRRAFDEAIKRFAAEGNISAHDVLRDQMRIFTDKAIKVLPPDSVGQGKKRIEKDVCSVLVAIDDMTELKKLNNMFGDRFKPLEFNTGGIVPATTRAEKYRTKRGRIKYKADDVRIPNTKYVFGGKMYVTTRIRNKIIRDKQSRVGRLKAGWEAAANLLGTRIPSWISKHRAPGSAIDTIRPGADTGYIEAVNNVPYVGRHEQATVKILQGRVRAIETRIDKELFRLGKKYSAK